MTKLPLHPANKHDCQVAMPQSYVTYGRHSKTCNAQKSLSSHNLVAVLLPTKVAVNHGLDLAKQCQNRTKNRT